MLAAADCRSAAACCWTEVLEGIRTYFCVLCKTVGKSAVAHHEICDIRRRNGGWKAVEVVVLKLFLLEGKLIGVYSLEIFRLLGSKPVSGLCSVIRPNHEPPRGSAQFAPNSVSSEVGKRGGLASKHRRLRWDMRRCNDFLE